MSKYKIEGGINFFEELYKSLDIEDNIEEDDNKCLISNTILTDKFVELECKHKFNYIPLYNDLVNHKMKFNNMESMSTFLKTNQIRCPYCRNKQNTLLPFYEELGLQKVNGVNFYDPKIGSNFNEHIYKNKCDYMVINEKYNDTINESETNKKYLPCCKFCSTQIIHYNSDNPFEALLTYGDNKYYCYEHKKIMIKKYKLEQKEKLLEEKKQLKAQQKTEKAKAKAEEKSKAKELKMLSKKQNDENVVLGPLTLNNEINGCIQILRNGLNKGKKCGCKIISENMCKRHFLLNQKELIINN
jgi:hypothetical protein